MSTRTSIEWTDVTWNPIRGCSMVNAACTNCYAMRQAHRFSGLGQPYEGLTRLGPNGPVWTGKVVFDERKLLEPLGWRKPRAIFVNSMSDLFHESLTDEQIDRVFAVMALCPQHTFQVLTKRPARMVEYVGLQHRNLRLGNAAFQVDGKRAMKLLHQRENDGTCRAYWPMPNVWLGGSVENQPTADERVPHLLRLAGLGWNVLVSYEPALGPVDFSAIKQDLGNGLFGDALRWSHMPYEGGEERPYPHIGCIIAGGESGPGARPSHPDWFRSTRDKCAAAGVSFFFKQWGEWGPCETFHLPDVRHGFAPIPMVRTQKGEEIYAGSVWSTGPSGRVRHTSFIDREPKGTAGGYVARVGKKAAGRLLDGREHNDLPWRAGG